MNRKTDCVDEFREWERSHNRENYGRYDAYKAGYDLHREEIDPILEERMLMAKFLETKGLLFDFADYKCGWIEK